MAVEATDSGQVLMGVDWQRLFPWLILFRTFKVAASATVLFIATCGAIATPVGWRMLAPLRPAHGETVQGDDAESHTDEAAVGRDESEERARDSEKAWDWEAFPWQALPASTSLRHPDRIIAEAPRQIVRMPARMLVPWWEAVFERISWSGLVYRVLGLCWTMLVWGLCGGLITRIAVVRLARDERVGLTETFQHVIRRPAYFLSPLLPQLTFLFAIIVGGLAGLFMRTGLGVLVMGLFWPVMLLFGLICAIIALGVSLGWPMMWVVTSAEQNGDVFEATQRSFSYSWERPLRYLFYVAVAFGFGCLSWVVVRAFTLAVVHFDLWSVAWGASWDRLSEVEAAQQGVTRVGWRIVEGWHALVASVAVGFSYSYFWTAYSAVYLLLRHDVDERVPLDRVYMPDEEQRYGLPALLQEEWGGPAATPGDSSPATDPEPDPPSSDEMEAEGAQATGTVAVDEKQSDDAGEDST